jgi:CheY-like chemotaxis protein
VTNAIRADVCNPSATRYGISPVSDIGLPGEDGYELIPQVRALPANAGGNIPAAALTAYARAEDRRKALDAGFMMHVPKPVEPAELVAVIANLTRFGVRR